MSLFSSLKNSAIKTFYKVADPVLTTFAHPIQVANAVIKKDVTVKQVQNQFFSQPKSSQITQTITAGLNYGISGAVGKSIITKGVVPFVTSLTTKKVVGTGALFVAENVVNNSPKIQQKIIELPKDASDFGKSLAIVVEEPSLENGLRVIKEHPFLSATSLIALLTSMGFSASLIATLMNTRAVNENTETDKETNNNLPPVVQNKDNPNSSSPVINYYIQSPPTPPTVSPEVVAPNTTTVAPSGAKIVAKPKKKAKKKPKKKAKKKTRRSKKKRKSIKRRKTRR